MNTNTIVCPECHHVNTNTQESMACTDCKEDLDHPFAVEVTDESAKVHIEENDIAVLVLPPVGHVWRCMKTMKTQRLGLGQR